MNCKHCGCPMLPKGQRKKPYEYDHAQFCPNEIKKGDRVRVCPWKKPEGIRGEMKSHPHADKTGVVIDSHPAILRNASILIDKGFDGAGNIMIVSLTCLEKL